MKYPKLRDVYPHWVRKAFYDWLEKEGKLGTPQVGNDYELYYYSSDFEYFKEHIWPKLIKEN